VFKRKTPKRRRNIRRPQLNGEPNIHLKRTEQITRGLIHDDDDFEWGGRGRNGRDSNERHYNLRGERKYPF
jgi:hypothetical protein